jgi:hypothetical protein
MLRSGAFLAFVVGLAGCGEKPPPPIVPATGVLTINGKTRAKAQICCYPQHPGLSSDYTASAITDENGRFTLETNGQPGACACEHLVVVTNEPAPLEIRGESAKAQMAAARYYEKLKGQEIPEQYGSVATTTLRITFSADKAEYNIDLK